MNIKQTSLVLLPLFLISLFLSTSCDKEKKDDSKQNLSFLMLIVSRIPYLMGGSIQGRALSLDAIVTTFAGPAQGSTTSGDTDETGNAARFYAPVYITTDGTKLYCTDFGNNKIRKIE